MSVTSFVIVALKGVQGIYEKAKTRQAGVALVVLVSINKGKKKERHG
jgi:hypothetical protein